MDPDDETRFFEHLTSESSLEVLLRGHLWVEAQLITALEEVIPFPSLVDFGRFTFPQKVALAAGHGFIRADDVPAYLKLNALRNRLAHRVTEEPDEAYATELYGVLGAHLRRLLAGFADEQRWEWSDWLQRLRLCIMAMYIALDTDTDRLRAYRRQVQAANEALRASAERLIDVASRLEEK